MRPSAPERQSIECRALLSFLDFQPNTCPALLADAMVETCDLVEDCADVETVVQKTLGLIDTMEVVKKVACNRLSQKGRLA